MPVKGLCVQRGEEASMEEEKWEEYAYSDRSERMQKIQERQRAQVTVF